MEFCQSEKVGTLVLAKFIFTTLFTMLYGV